MKLIQTNPMVDSTASRRVAVKWSEQRRAWPVRLRRLCPPAIVQNLPVVRRSASVRAVTRGFTILELMLVIAVIGLMMALALPHLAGFGKSNSMTAATRQLLDDCALARQRALVNRSDVYMVFVPPNFWAGTNIVVHTRQYTNLAAAQYTGYAIISASTVGDQPGRHYPHYLTDWKRLPQGIFIAPFQFGNTNGVSPQPTLVGTTNTTSSPLITHLFTVQPFNQVQLPFPSTVNGATYSLPCIGFSPRGQLLTTTNQYIVLASGSVFSPLGPNGMSQLNTPATIIETPAGNETNNPNIIALDALTARATLERNHF